jgi:arabinofuranosyltransferase
MRALQWFVLAIPLVIAAGAGWAHRFVTDDGYIYFRVIDQITAGNGPVFNAGERVEVFTSPLWVVVLTVGDVITPVRLEWLAVGLGLGLSLAGLGLAMAGARMLVRLDAPDAFLVPFGAFLYIALLPVWIFETSGLETGLVFAWEGLCLFVLADWVRSGRRLSFWRAAVLGLGWLVRPELVLFSALFVVLVLVVQWRTDRWVDRLRFLASALALPVVYQIFRMGYYGAFIANTGIVKEGTELNWDRGTRYFTDFTRPYWLWIPALILVLGGYVPLLATLFDARRRRAIAVVATFVAAGLLDGVYVIAVGGDYLHGRLLLPGVFALCAPVAVVPWMRRYAVALLATPWVFATALALRPPQARGQVLANGVLLPTQYGRVTTEDRGWALGETPAWYDGPGYYRQVTGSFVDRWEKVDLDLLPSVDQPVVLMAAIGLPSYALGGDFVVFDSYGLADPLTSHFDSSGERLGFPPIPGHEKAMPAAWAAARLQQPGPADPEDFIRSASPLIPETDGAEFQEQVAWARAALRCPDVRALLESARADLTPRRFASNLLHAFTRTRLRVPPDPKSAYEKFCGPDVPREVEAVRAERPTP